MREIGRLLNTAKAGGSPVYRHVERVHLAEAQRELKAGKVREVANLPFGLHGLNSYAAKSFGLPWRFGRGDVEVLKSEAPEEKRSVAAHERREAVLMAAGGTYEVAHAQAGEPRGSTFARLM